MYLTPENDHDRFRGAAQTVFEVMMRAGSRTKVQEFNRDRRGKGRGRRNYGPALHEHGPKLNVSARPNEGRGGGKKKRGEQKAQFETAGASRGMPQFLIGGKIKGIVRNGSSKSRPRRGRPAVFLKSLVERDIT